MKFTGNRLKLFWIFINITVFAQCYYCYATKPEYYYLREMLGTGLLLSRGSASVLNINCCLILLPVCRFINSYIHLTFSLISRTVLKYWLHNVQNIHVLIALTILIASLVHSAGHILNAVNASVHYNHRYPSINWASYQHENPFIMIVKSISGATGLLMILFLITMFVFSVPYSRRKDYVLFSTAHYLFLPFIVLYFIHPLSKVLKEQINLTEHNPGCSSNCTTDPIFVPIPVQSWKWMLPAVTVYLLDLLYRIVTRNRLFFVLKNVEKLPSNVYKLTLSGHGRTKIHPSQYILLQCPKISSIEWHPFTVVSCANNHTQTDVTILMRACGDWTNSLAQYLQTDFISSQPFSTQQAAHACVIRFLVDGGFFSPLSDILNKDVTFCIAGGIGITPFASILTYLKKNWQHCEYPHRIHLIWVVPYLECLLWLDDLLIDIHDQNWKYNKPDRLAYKLFVTREKNDTRVKMVIKSAILRSRIHLGKPDWYNVLYSWHSLYSKSSYPLYLCGSKKFTSSVEKATEQLVKQGIVFNSIHEAFT